LVIVRSPLLLRPSGTACQKMYGHPHRCSSSDVGWSLNSSGVLWAQDTPRDLFFSVTWPCSLIEIRVLLLLLLLWASQNFGWVGHNAFGPTTNWPVCSLIVHCGQLILGKISKIGASRYQIFRLKCTKFTFCWESLQCSPDPCLYLRGLLLRGWRETGEGEENVKGQEGENWREGFGPPKNFGVAPPMLRGALYRPTNHWTFSSLAK